MARAFALLGIVVGYLTVVLPVHARTIYVNNRLGDDRFDGHVAQRIDEFSGPVKTLTRALKIAQSSDTVELENTQIPYYESVSLVGRRMSGVESRPFEIIGNGAVLSGATAIPDGSWQKAGDDLWMLKPWRKGSFVLMRNEQMLPELRPQTGENWAAVPKLEPNQWCVLKGRIYFRSERLIEPQSISLTVASHDCGVTVYGVQHVRIVNLTIRHFRTDGISAHDLARHVTIENVNLVENGRAGIAVGGSSDVLMRGGSVQRNRSNSILIREAGSIEVLDTQLDIEPTLVRD